MAERQTPQSSARIGRPKSPAKRADHSALPVKKTLHELPESERFCLDTGLPLISVGTQVTTEIEYKRAELFLIEHTQVIFGPEHSVDRQVEERVAPLPRCPLVGGAASAYLLAWMLVQKYAILSARGHVLGLADAYRTRVLPVGPARQLQD